MEMKHFKMVILLLVAVQWVYVEVMEKCDFHLQEVVRLKKIDINIIT